ncbi:MAG: fimbrial protein [Proteobacteria bacterium]|nr:fimbrial protein [Pseudomonadota bacterium]
MKKILLIATVAALFSTQYASAADGTINFNGNITDTACTIDASSANQTVTMGTVSKTSFQGAGSTAAPTRFTISLTACPDTTAKVRFDGPTAPGNASILRLNTGETAEGVGVAIYEDDSSTLIPVSTASAAKTLSNAGENVLAYVAKYMATGDSVIAGSANATASFTITYP